MTDFIISKTTVQTLGIQAESLEEANRLATEGKGESISIQTNISVRPRPPKPQVSEKPLARPSTGAATVTRPGGLG